MSAIPWLMRGDPAIRWQTMRDLLGAPPEEVARERSRVLDEGWGARVLDLQQPDGSWAGGAWAPVPFPDPDLGQPWTATMWQLALLRAFGADPRDARMRAAVEGVAAHVHWENAGQAFFDGEVEPCINGLTVATGAYFGRDMTHVVERLLAEQLSDGGWNCESPHRSRVSSAHTTLQVLEGLAEHRVTHGATAEVFHAVRDAEEWLLERRLMFRRSTGRVMDPAFQRFSFPTRWHYDVLRALDYFRTSDAGRDPRLATAVDLVRSRQGTLGLWPLENTHRGEVAFDLESGDGKPSRWNTLRALRVLRWWERGASA